MSESTNNSEFCKHGHDWATNARLDTRGNRVCSKCRVESSNRSRAKASANARNGQKEQKVWTPPKSQQTPEFAKKARIIDLLMAKANGTNFAEERQAFLAKACELRAKYGIAA